MTKEFFMIDEEMFDEDSNSSAYVLLDNIIFETVEEAEEYLKDYFARNKFDQMKKEKKSDFESTFLMEDSSFNHKYNGEGPTKYFHVRKLKVFKKEGGETQ